jgi:hypothetical protein
MGVDELQLRRRIQEDVYVPKRPDDHIRLSVAIHITQGGGWASRRHG